jgi:hypothetical protein
MPHGDLKLARESDGYLLQREGHAICHASRAVLRPPFRGLKLPYLLSHRPQTFHAPGQLSAGGGPDRLAFWRAPVLQSLSADARPRVATNPHLFAESAATRDRAATPSQAPIQARIYRETTSQQRSCGALSEWLSCRLRTARTAASETWEGKLDAVSFPRGPRSSRT